MALKKGRVRDAFGMPISKTRLERVIEEIDTDGESGLSRAEFGLVCDRIADWAAQSFEIVLWAAQSNPTPNPNPNPNPKPKPKPNPKP